MIYKKLIFLLIIYSVSFSNAQPAFSINIIAPQILLDTSITAITIKDVCQLLQQACNCSVTINEKPREVNILLPFVNDSTASAPTRFSSAARYPYRHYPSHHYEWSHDKDKKGRYHLVLQASSFQGVSFGLYGLLQEQLGFKFVHPRQTIIPHWNEWPLKKDFYWKAEPLFDKKGFHLHTQHPIELTEPLLDENFPNALEQIKEYINWLVRNGQNYFEFCLLNSVKKKTWIHHARAITDYVHQRGLLASIDVSLHMIQQKNFKLYSHPFNKKKQIAKNLRWLNLAEWDFINMEFTAAEFVGGNRKKREQLRQYILKWVLQNSQAKLMGRQHVVKQENEFGLKKRIEWDSASKALDVHRGVLSHTVMFYDMTEPHAPVYENENQRHMFRFLLDEHAVRETWYYPESAYWVTFDNSVPLLLLPYLNARLADIDTCVRYAIPGHITFSSGWEWGYWLIDWSIARWSWSHRVNDTLMERYPSMYAREILGGDIAPLFDSLLRLQQIYLKDSILMQWMTAMTVTDELPFKKLAKMFHPRPVLGYKYIRNKATLEQLNQIKQNTLPLLNRFASASLPYASNLKNSCTSDTLGLCEEIAQGCEITALRALHRLNTLSHIMAKREGEIFKKRFKSTHFLQQAAEIRNRSLHIVREREKHYRYDLFLLAGKRRDHTAYHFGYLYPVHNLHFWYREEMQALKNQYRPLFMNIWNVARIIGIIK